MLAIALKFWLEGAKHGRIPPFLMPQSHRVLLNMAAGSIKQMVSFQLNMGVGSKTMKKVLVAEPLLPCVYT